MRRLLRFFAFVALLLWFSAPFVHAATSLVGKTLLPSVIGLSYCGPTGPTAPASYRLGGAGCGALAKAVVLHGVNDTGLSLVLLMLELGHSPNEVALLDLPGYGRTGAASPTAHPPDQQAVGVYAFMKDHGADECIGHSLGALVCYEVNAIDPQVVALGINPPLPIAGHAPRLTPDGRVGVRARPLLACGSASIVQSGATAPRHARRAPASPVDEQALLRILGFGDQKSRYCEGLRPTGHLSAQKATLALLADDGAWDTWTAGRFEGRSVGAVIDFEDGVVDADESASRALQLGIRAVPLAAGRANGSHAAQLTDPEGLAEALRELRSKLR